MGEKEEIEGCRQTDQTVTQSSIWGGGDQVDALLRADRTVRMYK